MTATNVDYIGAHESATNAIIDPNSRVADEDYFRNIKENKIMAALQKKQTERTMARTRFEDDGTVPVGAKAMMNPDVPNVDVVEMVPATTFKNKNPHTIRFIDPNISEN